MAEYPLTIGFLSLLAGVLIGLRLRAEAFRDLERKFKEQQQDFEVLRFQARQLRAEWRRQFERPN